MIRGVKVHVPAAVAAGVATILAVAAVAWRSSSLESLRQNFRRDGAQIQTNRSTVSELGTFSDERLVAARKAAAEFRGRIIADDVWDKFVREVAGEEWAPRPENDTGDNKWKGGEDYMMKRVTFTLLSNSISDWSKVMKFLEAVEQRKSDFGVSRVDVRTIGDRDMRKFDSVQIEIVFFARRA